MTGETNITSFISSHPDGFVSFLEQINIITGNVWGLILSAIFTVLIFAWIHNQTQNKLASALMGGFGALVVNLLFLYMGLLNQTSALIFIVIPAFIMGFAMLTLES